MKMRRIRTDAGTVLAEILIALLVVAVGMTGLHQMQLMLIRNNDLAAQRTVATQLASECMENLRSLRGTTDWDNLPGTRCPASITDRNASYSRTVTLLGNTSDSLRTVRVGVSWTDREGKSQEVKMVSHISNSSPIVTGMLAFPPPPGEILKKPKDRNLNIPIPALLLPKIEGMPPMSAIQMTSNVVIIFNNATGAVSHLCAPGFSNADAEYLGNMVSSNLCTLISGYIVTGYISRDSTVNSTSWNNIESGLGINYSDLTLNSAASASPVSCYIGNALATGTDYKWYLCLIRLTGDKKWSGTIRVGGPAALRTNDCFVCRYVYASANGFPNNDRNVQPYDNVDHTIDLQNYRIASGSGSCSALADMNVTGVVEGVLHQDCRAANPDRASHCPAPSP